MHSRSICMRAIFLVILGAGATVQAFPAEDPTGVGVIWAYAGTWKTETASFDTAHSKAGHDTATLRNSCWKDGSYLACNQYVDGDSKVLLVFTYNDKEKSYATYQVPSDGGKPGMGKLIVEGNVWTFPWQTTEGETATYFRVVNTFTSPERIEFRREFSTDKIHWTVMAKGVTSKVSGQ
jgi:hypothetical protein